MTLEMTEAANRLRIFKLFNFAFCLIWLVLPFSIAAFYEYWDDAIIFAGLKDGCASLPVLELSASGKIATNLFFITDTIFYLVLFGLMHLLVYDAAKGRFLINRTISTIGYIAALILLWTTLTVFTFNLTKYYLFSIGDINSFTPDYSIDVVMIGAGFFFVVLRYILLHAFKLQEDAKLTV
jgi:hypothetical protein